MTVVLKIENFKWVTWYYCSTQGSKSFREIFKKGSWKLFEGDGSSNKPSVD